jgi:hypothetical protein
MEAKLEAMLNGLKEEIMENNPPPFPVGIFRHIPPSPTLLPFINFLISSFITLSPSLLSYPLLYYLILNLMLHFPPAYVKYLIK